MNVRSKALQRGWSRSRPSLPGLTRRQLLGGALATTASVPLLNSHRARGQADVPKRMVVVATPNGTRNELFWPVSGPDGLVFPEYTAPLAPLADKLTFLKGIRHCPAVVGDNGFNGGLNGSEHARGIGGLLTARPLGTGTFQSFMATSGWGSGISIDQHIANVLNPPTTFKTLELGVHVRDAEVRGRIAYAGPDRPIPPREDPRDVFAALFGDLAADAGGDGGMAATTLEELRRQRRSVFDLTLAELNRMEGILGAEDKVKLQAHRDAIRDIEQRLTTAGDASERVAEGGKCVVPQVDPEINLGDDDTLEATGRLQMDLAAAALACDQTRIITLQWNYAESEHLFKFLDLTRNHHVISHDWQGTTGFAEYGRIQTWFAEQVFYLLSALNSSTEGDGSVLDNTVVFWGSEIGESTQHDLTMMPYVIAGGAGGAFTTGRVVDYGSARRDNNQLLVSIAQMMGAEEVTSFGDESGAPGELPELQA